MKPNFNLNYENTKVLIISLSTYCINNCEGCTYTKKERNEMFLISLNDFENLIENFTFYCYNNSFVPHFLLGTGEIMEFELESYFDIILKYNNKAIIEISTTGKIDNFQEKINFITNKFENTNIKIILEYVFDILKENKEDLGKIKKSYEIGLKTDFEIHNILKVSLLYKEQTNKIIENLKYIGVKLLTFDYLFLDNSKQYKLIELKEYINYFNKIKKELNINNIKIANFAYDYHNLDNDNLDYANNAYYIDKELNLYYVVELPYGDFILNEKNSNYKKILNNKDLSKTIFNNKLSTYDKINYQKNILNIQTNVICQNCKYKNICPSSFIFDISKFNNIEFSDEYCLGVKNLIELTKVKK